MSIQDVKIIEKKEIVAKKGPSGRVPQISWQTLEYTYYPKSNDWYWSVGIIAVGLFIVAYIQRNFLFGVLVLLGGFSVLLYGARQPKKIEVTITGQGIQIDDRLFPHEELKSFWVFYMPGDVKELSLKLEKTLAPYLRIPLGDANPSDIRTFLLNYLPEKKQEDSLIDALMRYLQF